MGIKDLIKETEILNIEVEDDTVWIGERWEVPNSSKGYHGLLKEWFDHFGLKGKGLLIGERTQAVKEVFQEAFPEAEILTADFSDKIGVNNLGDESPDIDWNICKPFQSKKKYNKKKYNWIVCQAVLEHVVDPYGAVRNMLKILGKGGRLFIHTHSPEFQEHRFPIDCYRFLRDIWFEYAKEFDVKIDDLLWLDRHSFVVYKQKN